MEDPSNPKDKSEFKSFAGIRIILAAILMVAVVWALVYGLDYLVTLLPSPSSPTAVIPATVPTPENDAHPSAPAVGASEDKEAAPKPETAMAAQDKGETAPAATPSAPESDADDNNAQSPGSEIQVSPEVRDLILGDVIKKKPAAPEKTPQTQPEPQAKASETPAETPETSKPAAQPHAEAKPAPAETAASAPKAEAEKEAASIHEPQPTGVRLIEAVIAPMDHELNHRWWGWRPNDIVNLTDNVNNYQLGVLEVTRRTIVQLAERISRTGSTDAFNPHLENAMNWIMIKADRYWFPSPESKYKECLTELANYKKQLIEGRASFYTRSDNIIPLLAAFEDLLGSCDENLVKATESDGTKVGFFKADNYFYYAQGIADAMAGILEAVQHDFTDVLDKRNGAELLHHAILSCERAAGLNPWIITNADLDGVLANHRANMAAPISHAKFYLSQLIKTLST